MDANQKVRQELFNSVSGFTNQQLNEKISEDTWSIMQNLEHLYLMERLVVQSILKELKNDASTTADEKPIHYTVNRSRKVKAPSFLEPSGEYITYEDIYTKLNDTRNSLLAIKDEVKNEMLEQKSFEHPIFGRLSLKQWIEFIGYHEKRHLEQIEEIKLKIKSTS